MRLFRKRYCLFAGSVRSPEGGAMDFVRFGSIRELKKRYGDIISRVGPAEDYWAHITDPSTMKIVLLCYKGEWSVPEMHPAYCDWLEWRLLGGPGNA